jgi:hypothetical protein
MGFEHARDKIHVLASDDIFLDLPLLGRSSSAPITPNAKALFNNRQNFLNL